MKSYRPASLHTGKEWYISFYAFDPQSDKLKRKRIKINFIDKASERRRYANELIKKININLAKGWNPFFDSKAHKAYRKIDEAMDHFLSFNTKKYKGGDIRRETWNEYNSKMHNLREWLTERNSIDLYTYKFTTEICNAFLEYIFIERDRTSQTRDNYLRFLRVFGTFMMEHQYIKVRPTETIKVIGKSKTRGKNRSIISIDDRKKLREYLEVENPAFFVACMVEYYCFIRPKEMSYIKISHVNLERETVYIPGITAKNHKDAIVTIPQPLKKLLKKMKLSSYPGDYYLFSHYFSPGKDRRSEKAFRDYWGKVRIALDFPETYKFYSLKDTGITDLIGQLGDTRMVRDQARHHSIAITDIYTPHDIMKSNPYIAKNKSEF